MKAQPISKTLGGLSGIGPLGKIEEQVIKAGKVNIQKAIKASKKPPTKKKILSFDETFELYNHGISKAEINAWVWYQRSLGIPMKGWEKFYLKGDKSGNEKRLKTNNRTVVRDLSYKEIRSIPPNIFLGKYIPGKETTPSGEVWLKYRSLEGIFMAREADVSTEQVAKSYGSTSELKKLVSDGALFFSAGELLPAPVFTFGNMYDKILALQKDAQYIESTYGSEVLEKHRKIIREATPPKLSVLDPVPSERPRILAISTFSRNFQLENLKQHTGIVLESPISLIDAFSLWLSQLDRTDFEDSNAFEIDKHYLKGTSIRTRGADKEERQRIKARTQKEGEILFARFLHEALLVEDQKRLDIAWNREYNGQARINYQKIPVGFESSAKFKQFNLQIRPAQREAIAFMKAVGAGGIAYEVGLGKTISAIITLADALYSGRAKRALVVVPNATYKNWLAEIEGESVGRKKRIVAPGVLTGTSVKVNDWYNLNKRIQSKISLKRAVSANSITVVTYEGFKRIGFSKQVLDELIIGLANVLEQSRANIGERDLEIDYQKYRQMLGIGLKNTIADIDVLGFDYLVFDEAHRCKNVFNQVKKDGNGKKRFGISGSQSEIGLKAFFLSNYIQQKYGEKVMLLSATPFTNSPLEIYSMLSLIAFNKLKSMGIVNIQLFFELFVREETEYAVTYKETIEPRRVIKGFNNRLVLQRLIFNHFNHKTGEEAGIKRPCKINLPRLKEKDADGKIITLKSDKQVLTYLDMTAPQRKIQDRVTQSAKDASAGRRINVGGIFRALSASLDNAFSPFLQSDEEPKDFTDFVENSPKIHYICKCIESVRDYHLKNEEPVSGQVIYSNRGKVFFPYIKQYLVEKIGFRRGVSFGSRSIDEVEIIEGSTSQSKKERIRHAFQDGIVKVIIGTSTIREGINLQKRSTVLYNAYPDWNPTDLRQLEGRVWRQGNRYGYVRVVMPLIKDSADVFVFQKLEEKTARINDIWYRSDRGNVLDLESLDPEEIKYALLTDIELIAKQLIKTEVAKAERKRSHVEFYLKAIEEVIQNLALVDQARERLKRAINRTFQHLRTKPHIQNPQSADYYKEEGYSSKEWKQMLTEQDFVAYCKEKHQYSEPTDKELLSLGKKASYLSVWYDQVTLNRFRELYAKLLKTEKSVLIPKGYSLSDDLSKATEDYQNDLNKAEEEVKRLGSVDYFRETVRKVEERKNKGNVSGKSVAERVKEFASLNHLLSYLSEDNNQSCSLPAAGKAPTRSKSMELIRIRARALQLKMKMEMEMLKIA